MEYINIKKLIDIIRKEYRQHANTKERVANVLDEILKFTYDNYQVKGEYVTNDALLEYLNGKVNTDGSNIEDIEAWQLILDFYSKNESDLRYKSIDYIPSWTEISGKPSSFNPSAHNHSISDINGLNEQIDLILTDIDIINEDYVNLQQEVDEVVQALDGKEDKANKQDSLTTDGTGTKYPTVDAVNSGLNSKISGDGIINRIPKYIDEKVIGFSNITDNGTSVDINTTSYPNSSKLIFKTTGSGSFIDSYHFISDTYNDIIINQLGGNLGIGKAPSTTEKLDVNGSVRANLYKFNLSASVTPTPNTLVPKTDGSGLIWYNNSSVGAEIPIYSSPLSNYIARWDGTKFVNGTIQDNGTNVGIGAPALGALLDVRAQGNLDSDIVFRVRNSDNTQDFLVVNGAGDVYNRGANGNLYNTFFGENVGRNSVTTDNNAFGYNALSLNITGTHNSVFGGSALYSNTTGSLNSAFGNNALYSNTTGNSNSAFGFNALYSNTTGNQNIAFGNTAGDSTMDGSSNTASNNSIYIGFDTRANANNETNQIVIGHSAIGNGSNTITLGHTTIENTYLRGKINLNNRLKLASYTKTQRNALTNKEVGDMIWQTDSGNSGIRVYDGTNWLALQTTVD